MIKVLFFATLREQLSCHELEVSTDNINTIAALLSHLSSQSTDWQHALSTNVLCAVNQQMADTQHRINDGDEVAFFPPVTGG
ncbi:molybdopterin converting factor subunit 1 [Thalassotalea sp. 1_MG-2023]|uniref:molybdopterin converting factor subunit 1 n=1 Tax=Thalassotalea sp. 1_MG-2023 TaxID=3062680 RepID=UPI0026E17F78|nr:molybdopterin converting factor subunit 1 [Thalassotalea sp. 1_MG-2023]MDO6426409.1 molybdopterin converting factor subunit 1 [Thalassotalea sp. 1_MG-2023]